MDMSKLTEDDRRVLEYLDSFEAEFGCSDFLMGVPRIDGYGNLGLTTA